MSDHITAYPLAWPSGWPRTKMRKRSRFQVAFTAARDGLLEEVRRLGGKLPIISSDLELRLDGLPYANQSEPKDQGVAVYFTYKEKQMCFACDQWDKIKDNIQAIRKTIEAFRGMERWGASDMMNRAFTAFTALPPAESWREILVDSNDLGTVEAAYQIKRKAAHPDHGGSDGEFHRVQSAWEQAKAELNG